MTKHSKIIQSGQICLNKKCQDYEVVGAMNIIRFGKDRYGHQRFRCKSCNQCFCERKGTFFYRKHTEDSVIISSLTSIGRGARLESVAQAQNKKSETIAKWLRQAGQHAEKLEAVLFKDYQVDASQVDGLWSYVKNKGEKK